VNLPGLSLTFDITNQAKQGLVANFNSQVGTTTPVLFRQDQAQVTLRPVEPSVTATRPWDDVGSLSTANVELGVDNTDLIPTSGNFTLTFGANTTANIPFPATAAAVASALNALTSITAAGGVTVALQGADYIITWNSNGAQALLTATNESLFPPSNIYISEDEAGGSTDAEIQILTIIQAPAAFQNSWTDAPGAGSIVTETQVGSGSVPSSQQVQLSPAPYDGSFTLQTALGTTGAIPYNASAAQVAALLNALFGPVTSSSVLTQAGVRATTNCATTATQNTVTASSVTNIAPGDLVTSGGVFATGTTVVSISGSVLTLSTLATSTNAAASLTFSTPSAQSVSFSATLTQGTFTLTTSLGTTSALAYNASAAVITAALNAISGAAPNQYAATVSSGVITITDTSGVNTLIVTVTTGLSQPVGNQYTVTGNAAGPWTITDASGSNTVIVVNVAGLIAPQGLTGTLYLNTAAMQARFDAAAAGTTSIQLLLEVKIGFSGNPPSTYLQIPVTISKNVLRSGITYSPTSPSNALLYINNDFSVTGFTGGGTSNMDGIATVLRQIGELHAIVVSGGFYVYQLVSGTFPGGSAPAVIEPADYNASTNARYWKLVGSVVGPIKRNATIAPSAAGTNTIIRGSFFTLQRIAPTAGSGAYTSVVVLPASPSDGDIVRFDLALPASSNPTLVFKDGAGNVKDTVICNGNAFNSHSEFHYDSSTTTWYLDFRTA
jgi:hypothetical protein